MEIKKSYPSTEYNVKTKKPYHGKQGGVLEDERRYKGYSSHQWGTFLCWKELGRKINKGEKSTLCFHPTFKKTGKFDEDGNEIFKKMRKYFRVFNKDQTSVYQPEKVQVS